MCPGKVVLCPSSRGTSLDTLKSVIWEDQADVDERTQRSFCEELAWSFSEVRYAHQGVFATLLRGLERPS